MKLKYLDHSLCCFQEDCKEHIQRYWPPNSESGLYSCKTVIDIQNLKEEKAAYTKEKVDLLLLAKKLTRLGKVVFLSRYDRQADLFVGVGGTITREAALQGTPAIVVNLFADQYVNDFLAEKGFPIYRAEQSGALELSQKLLGKKHPVDHALKDLENPVDVIENIVEQKVHEN
jgi:predicted glycosyltransferase